MECPRCKSTEDIVKSGIMQKRQRYLCKKCHYNFTIHPERGKPMEMKRRAVQFYLEGLGYRSIGRLLGVSQVSVMNWIQSIGEKLPEPAVPDTVEVMELDEMWHYVGKKNENVGYGSLFAVKQKKSSDMHWVVVARKQD